LASEDKQAHVGGFPRTRHSAIDALKTGDGNQRRVAMNRVIGIYWAPVYKYLRLRWHKGAQEAEDLTQGFFLSALEGEYLASFDPAKARFRTFLRVCLDRFVNRQNESASAQKRGGDTEHLSLDFAFVEGEILSRNSQSAMNPEVLFEQEWIRSLFSRCVEQLKAQSEAAGKSVAFAMFQSYDLGATDSPEPPSYQDLANKHGVTVETVTNYLAAMRREFRRIVLAEIRELTSSDEEYREEVRAILGINVE
jgi:RNA polymerase sigma factor (sigma-70 family)